MLGKYPEMFRGPVIKNGVCKREGHSCPGTLSRKERRKLKKTATQTCFSVDLGTSRKKASPDPRHHRDGAF